MATDRRVAKTVVGLILPALHREYPNKLAHTLLSDADAAPPRQLTPLFFGCFDWHSAVHSHWTLVRLLRDHPEADWAEPVRGALRDSFRPEKVLAEVAYLSRADRAGFEMPYGIAWLLRLAAELHRLDDPDAAHWRTVLGPLEKLAADRFRDWLGRLRWPIRSGQHSQSAFAMGLALDWARCRGRPRFERRLVERALAFHRNDRDAPLAYEPSAYDFLSPSLGAADLMARVLGAAEFSEWLDSFLPLRRTGQLADHLSPVSPIDRTDGKLVHFDGLNLSRAWMLSGIASVLPQGEVRRDQLVALAQAHGRAGLEGIVTEDYVGAHWLGTFAVCWSMCAVAAQA